MGSSRMHIKCVAVFITALFAIAAAHLPARGAQPASSPDEKTTVEKFVVGKSVGGRPIECQAFGHGPDVLMVIATIHGNESSGTPLVAAFADWLVAHPDQLAGRTVVIVPVANPDGLAADKRFNAHEVDLNRNFPAGNWGVPQEEGGVTSPGGDTFARSETLKPGDTPLSEPESRALMQLICRYYPNRIISIHQPIGCIDYDGSAEPLAAAMAAKCPLQVHQVGSRPGSLGSFVGNTLKRPIITWELPEDAGQNADSLWKTYGESLIVALHFDGKNGNRK